jgi:hypothetical protein
MFDGNLLEKISKNMNLNKFLNQEANDNLKVFRGLSPNPLTLIGLGEANITSKTLNNLNFEYCKSKPYLKT